MQLSKHWMDGGSKESGCSEREYAPIPWESGFLWLINEQEHFHVNM